MFMNPGQPWRQSRLSAIFRHGLWLWLFGITPLSTALAEITVHDDAGNAVTLRSPARRIVSLAPHVTELLYAAGAGNYIVGAVEYSDYPEEAKHIPRIGSGFGFDIEAIIGLQPDLVISWKSGNPPWQTERLKDLGFPVFVTEPRHIGDVASLIGRFGKISATEKHANEAVDAFQRHQRSLRERYATRPPVTVFYQILDSSLLTVSQRHLISDVIRLCSGTNVFAGLPGLTPRVDVESVLQKNPEAILASGYEPLWAVWRERWRVFPALSANSHANLFFIPPDLIHRHSPRILQAAEQVCTALEAARESQKVSRVR